MSNVIYHDVDIVADLSSIYDAVTEPKHLNNWWTYKCSGVPFKGAKYNLHFSEAYDWYGEVTQCESDRSFAITMVKSDDQWDYTTFGFEISAVDESISRVSFYHKDWRETGHPYRKTSYSWALLLQGLKQYLEEGTIIPFEERA